MDKNEWYSARTIYKHYISKKRVKSKLYEERVVLIKAKSFDDAISKAEKEAQEYVLKNKDTKFLEYVNVYKLFDEKMQNNTEVYSLMRETNLDEKDYLDHFFDTGLEKTK